MWWEERRSHNDFSSRATCKFLRPNFSGEKGILILNRPVDGRKLIIVRSASDERRQLKDFAREISICRESIVAFRFFFNRLNWSKLIVEIVNYSIQE